ncbi:hypothetical protein DVH24_013578 [Malus domestica]|uniref:Uncharacterized protein n=1 Tax=Malus domestica TaxID=3750 RepID=A0A498JH44_MALDO|nr:hypothetical protein DVH24_013578 [Malus domestica]
MDVESKDGLPKKTYGFKQGFSDVQAGLCPRVLISNRCWFTKKTRDGEVSWWKQRYELGCISKSGEQETMKTKQEELMEICNGRRDGAAAVSNKDVNAKAFRKHHKVKEWPRTIETQEAMCVDSPSKRGKENALDQSNDVKYWDAAKQDELMETCNAAEMVLLL